MQQHLQMTRITVKGFTTMEAVPCKLPLMQHLCDSHLVSLGFMISSSGKQRTAWMPFIASAFWGNNKTTSKRWSWFQKTSISPSLMKLPALKRAVICDKNSGGKFHEQRSEFANELHYLPSKCSSTIISLANQLSWIELLLL